MAKKPNARTPITRGQDRGAQARALQGVVKKINEPKSPGLRNPITVFQENRKAVALTEKASQLNTEKQKFSEEGTSMGRAQRVNKAKKKSK